MQIYILLCLGITELVHLLRLSNVIKKFIKAVQ